jgi:hypothetical protein
VKILYFIYENNSKYIVLTKNVVNTNVTSTNPWILNNRHFTPSTLQNHFKLIFFKDFTERHRRIWYYLSFKLFFFEGSTRYQMQHQNFSKLLVQNKVFGAVQIPKIFLRILGDLVPKFENVVLFGFSIGT